MNEPTLTIPERQALSLALQHDTSGMTFIGVNVYINNDIATQEIREQIESIPGGATSSPSGKTGCLDAIVGRVRIFVYRHPARR